jgi:hypothetical protein
MLPRILVALGLTAGLAACSQATAGEDRPDVAVLFIGNSLTSVNDLPAAVAKVAEAAHDTVRVGMAPAPTSPSSTTPTGPPTPSGRSTAAGGAS